MSEWTDNQPEGEGCHGCGHKPHWAWKVVLAFIFIGILWATYETGKVDAKAEYQPSMTEAGLVMAHQNGQLDMCQAIIGALNSDGKFFVINAPMVNGPGGG